MKARTPPMTPREIAALYARVNAVLAGPLWMAMRKPGVPLPSSLDTREWESDAIEERLTGAQQALAAVLGKEHSIASLLVKAERSIREFHARSSENCDCGVCRRQGAMKA